MIKQVQYSRNRKGKSMSKAIESQAYIKTIKNNMIGCRYRHFKGDIYIVTDVAVDTETEEPVVIYKDFHSH